MKNIIKRTSPNFRKINKNSPSKKQKKKKMDKYIKQKKGTKRNNKKIPQLVTELQKQPPEVFCKKRCS